MGIGRARMVVGTLLVAMALLGTALAPAGASTGAAGGGGGDFRPGAPGVGDDTFPLHGNGGYDVKHYLLKVSYDRPPTGWSGWPRSRPGRPRTCPASTSTSSE